MEGVKSCFRTNKGMASLLATVFFFISLCSYIFNLQDCTVRQKRHLYHTHGIHRNLQIESTDISSFVKCDDPFWCNVPVPTKSLFRFSPPTDEVKWKMACAKAASGETVLLKESRKYFPHTMDFLDGDILFREYHRPIDFFIDDNTDFSILNSKESIRKFANPMKHQVIYSWRNTSFKDVIPPPYHYLRKMDRAPVLKLGYFAFKRTHNEPYFGGTKLGEAPIGRKMFLTKWKQSSKSIDTPFILLHSSNENWGLLSTFMPNRTARWGTCCNKDKDEILNEFLDHPMTLMLLVNQHTNFTHPKVLVLPRGLPLQTMHNRKIVWDTMRILQDKRKNQMVFTSSSSWGYRSNISSCISSKFLGDEVKGRSYDGSWSGRLTPSEYYSKLGLSRFSLALPGLGYDTYRLWESMTIGTIPILERGVGFDRTLWKLPALIVDDFDNITPELLKVAYIESIYRAEEFEFDRLTQSFWWTLIANVSRSRSIDPLLAKFPLESMEANFMRPNERFTCHATDSCGKGTKFIPKTIC